MFESFYPGMSWAAHQHRWPHAQHSRLVQAGGIQWHVQSMGQGPCLLLLHGTGSGNFSWRSLMPLLAPHFTVVAPDLPGHAFTSRGPDGALSLAGMGEGLRALMLQADADAAVDPAQQGGALAVAQRAQRGAAVLAGEGKAFGERKAGVVHADQGLARHRVQQGGAATGAGLPATGQKVGEQGRVLGGHGRWKAAAVCVNAVVAAED